MTHQDTQRRWPIAAMLLVFVIAAFFWLLSRSSFSTSRSVFTDPIGGGVLAMFFIRIVAAGVRKEEGRGWIFYLALLIAVPIAVEIYAWTCIPFFDPVLPHAL